MRFFQIMAIVMLAIALAIGGCTKSTTETPPAQTTPQDTPTTEPAAPPAQETAPAEETTPAEEETTEEETAPAEETTEEETSEEETPVEETVKTISIKGFKAYPDELTIPVGTTVRWKNDGDNFRHIIAWNYYYKDAPKNPGMLAGQSWEYTFDEPGELTWFSTAKPTTQGKIIITE